jgi:uncharacterized protein YidB (DUF937 family)
MGLIEQIASVALRQAVGSGGTAVTGLVLDMLGNRANGGLSGIVNQFTTAGLSEIIGSWISTGPNMAISSEHMRMAFGQQQVQQMAQQSGLPLDQLLAGLARQMPELINQLTPQGQVPQQSALDETLAQLRQRLGLG